MWEKIQEVLKEMEETLGKLSSKEEELFLSLQKGEYPKVLSLLRDMEALSKKLERIEKKRKKVLERFFHKDLPLSSLIELFPDEESRIYWEKKHKELKEKAFYIQKMQEKLLSLLEVYWDLASSYREKIQKEREAGYSPQGVPLYSSSSSGMEVRG